MAATSLTVANTIYSNKVIEGLQYLMPRFNGFSIDFSDETREPGDTIQVAKVVANAVAEWNRETNNYKGSADEPLQKIDVKLTSRPIVGFNITQDMLMKFNPAHWERKAEQNVRALSNWLFNPILAAIKDKSQFATEKVTPLTGFTRDTVTELRALAVKSKFPINETTLYLNPDFFSKLLSLLTSDVYGGDMAIKRGVIEGLFGFHAVVEIPSMDIAGFAALPQAFGIASRAVPVADDKPYQIRSTMTDPASGLTLTNTIFTDGGPAVTRFSTETMWGASVADETALIRFVAEATPDPAPDPEP